MKIQTEFTLAFITLCLAGFFIGYGNQIFGFLSSVLCLFLSVHSAKRLEENIIINLKNSFSITTSKEAKPYE